MALDVWRCPRCRGALTADVGTVVCRSCEVVYPVIGDSILDLRVDAPAWVDADEDRERARSLLALPDHWSGVELAFHVFSRRPGWTEQRARYRTEQIRHHPERMIREFDGWLVEATRTGSPVLDLGCGTGGLLAAAARRGIPGIGIDVSVEWLVVAQRIITEHGGRPVLAAAMGEALPLSSDSVGAVLSLDVIEHVGDQRAYLREINRVLRPGGVFAMATPNRYSITPEPHVGVWGVGWLPRAWQPLYVKRRSGQPYEFCRLLSVREIRRLMNSCTSLRTRIAAGEIPHEEMATFSDRKRRAARAYNRLAAAVGIQSLIRPICPFFQVVARKPASARV